LVTDWRLVAGAGVRDCYVKLSDGGGPAAVRGDAYVAGARAAGIAVGGYHYMQPSPSPEAQADVFAAELTRLGALDIAPALDLEQATIPAASRVDYGRRFLLHLQAKLNISRVAVYSSASWFAALKPDAWGVPGLVDWVAQYGVNDGGEHAITYSVGHVDVHQYTSSGHVPGITGSVDLDDVLADISEQPTAVATVAEDDVGLITGDWPAGTAQRHYLVCPMGSVSSIIAQGWFSLATGWANATGHIWFVGTTGGKANYLSEEDFTLSMNCRSLWSLPDGTDQIGILFTSPNAVGWCLETQAK
jgi:GH25 family lysozyme M1 (1,4-beta-N-acetylmuramidase)